MSVKRIRLYIKAKRKIHNNVGHETQQIFSSFSENFFNLARILTRYPNRHRHTSTSNKKRTDRCEQMDLSCAGNNILPVQ